VGLRRPYGWIAGRHPGPERKRSGVAAARRRDDSHSKAIAGWGYFRIKGESIGSITAEQVGKLAPGDDYAGDPDNYGCGFIDKNRLLTTAIGNTLPGQPANGQLFLWFGPFDSVRPATTESGTGYFTGDVAHCEIDRGLATAGGIAVDDNGDVYVATNRPDDEGHPGGVWRYRGVFPRTPSECTPAFVEQNITKQLLIPFVNQLPADLRAPTPSAVVISPDDTLYVSSVFSGTVSEFTKSGRWVRDLFPLSPVTAPTGPTGNTPFGMAVTSDGALWIADLGIVVGAPVEGMGSVIRVPFDAARNPTPLGETVADGLTFPDGLGVYRPN
jgi:hypothetical protein